MELRLFGVRIHAHPLLLMMVPLAMKLGAGREIAAVACALTVHECAHLAAARALGVAVTELRLTPFGGSAGIGNPYALSPLQLGLTAAAGPGANLALILVFAALAHWNAVPPAAAALSIRANLILMLFNLLPALPLDGGRILYCALRRPIGPDRALAAGIWTGRALALCLLVLAVCLFVRSGVVNLSYIFAAVFIVASAPGERAALTGADIHTLIGALSPITGAMPVNLIAIDSMTTVQKALSQARPDRVNLYAVYSGNALAGFTDDRALLSLCLEQGPTIPVGRAVSVLKHKESTGRPD